MDRVHKPRFKLDSTKKMKVLHEVLEYERNWKMQKKRRNFLLKSIHIGITVCVSAVFLFILGTFIFHEWNPLTEKQTAQTTKGTATSKKSEIKIGRLMPVQIMPHYKRNNDVEINVGPYSLTAIGGVLTDDKKNGAVIIHYYTDKTPLGSDYLISTGNHGALSVYEEGTKLRVVAEDGMEWKMIFKFDGNIRSYEFTD